MITGRFEFAGTRRFSELPEGALFVKGGLCLWHNYWVEEGLLVYGAREGQEELVYRKERDGEREIGVRLDNGEKEHWRLWSDAWVTQLKEVEGGRCIWMKREMYAFVTTFGQLAEGETFIRAEGPRSLEGLSSSSPNTPHVYRKKGEVGVYLSGEDEVKLPRLERVIPVHVGDVRSPEYVVMRVLERGRPRGIYPAKRSEVEDHPEHYEIVEGGFEDYASAAERAKQLWSEREEPTVDS